MTDPAPPILARRQRSKSLGAIKAKISPKNRPTAPVFAQECTPPVDNSLDTSRCACGRLLPVFASELRQSLNLETPAANTRSFERGEAQVSAGAEEQDEDNAQGGMIMQNRGSSTEEEDVENDGPNAKDVQDWINETGNDTEDSDTPSFHTCHEEIEDDTTTALPTISPSHPPLPSPNRLTSTYLPFHSHLALSNHLSPSKISHHLTAATPFFLHGTLQLPSTLSHILGIRLPSILRRLTPAVLLEHTTNVDTQSLLPSLVEVGMMSAYREVQGLLFFPSFPKSTAVPVSISDIINDFYKVHEKCEMKKARLEIEDSRGRRQQISAWAWISNETGVEERWTLEEFIAGDITGFGAMEW